jgi:hypothetical protein
MNKFLDRFLPYYAPETEAGLPEAVPQTPPPDAGGAGEAATPEPRDGKTEKLSIRQSLERGFADAKLQDPAQKPAPKAPKAKDKPARAADEMRAEAEGAQPAEGEAPAGEAAETPAETAPKTAAPAAWPKEAKETWAALPPAVQAAVLKRETDVQKGVDELKGKYAEIDGAIAPHIDAIRRHGHTPAQAVNQMFSWFHALAGNPDVAFPALLRSFNFDPRRLVPQQQQQPVAQPGNQQPQAAAVGADGKPIAAAQPADAVPPAVQNYINQITNKLSQLENAFSQKIGAVENTFQQQSEAKTQEVLMNWAKDKPHFEKVRVLMSQLIASGAVPLKDGRVDLDGAYDAAIYANPEVRGSLQAEQQKAAQAAQIAAAAKEKAAQQAAADKARKTNVSLAPSAPGQAPAPKAKKGRSVRESLKDAMEELNA